MSTTLAPPPRGLWRRFAGLAGWKKALIVLCVLLLLLAGGLVGGAYALVNRYEGRVERQDLLGPVQAPRDEQRWRQGPLNLLLLGSDSRDIDLSTGGGQRSDTIMLVHIGRNFDRATVISIPRDSYVDIPAGGSWPGGPNKLNSALSFGGVPLAAQAVSELVGVPIDGAMVANFASIHAMVDAVEGVNVCLPYRVKSTFSDRVWEAGCHDLDGPTAEELMRQRFNVPGGDFGRMYNQQLVVKAIVQKVADQGLLGSPWLMDNLLVTAAEAVTVDKRLDLRELLLAVRDIRPGDISTATVPYVSADLDTPAGTAVELDEQAAAELFEAVREDTVEQWLAANPQRPPTS